MPVQRARSNTPAGDHTLTERRLPYHAVGEQIQGVELVAEDAVQALGMTRFVSSRRISRACSLRAERAYFVRAQFSIDSKTRQRIYR